MYDYYCIDIDFDGNDQNGKRKEIGWRIRESGLEICLSRDSSCIGSNANGTGIKSVEGALEDIFNEIREIVLNDAREIYEKRKMADKI